MGDYPIDPAQVAAFRWLMAMFYLMSLAAILHAALGITRVARLPMPVEFNDDATRYHLFPIDYSPKLYSWHGRPMKTVKIAVLAVGGAFYLTVWGTVSYFTYSAGDTWFGWDFLPIGAALGLHIALPMAAVVLGVWRGWNRYGTGRKGWFRPIR